MELQDKLAQLNLLRNDPELVNDFIEAARAGEADAQYALGLIYAEGRGVDINLVEAYAWLSAAADQGDEDAITLRYPVVDQMTDAEYLTGKKLANIYIQQLFDSTTQH